MSSMVRIDVCAKAVGYDDLRTGVRSFLCGDLNATLWPYGAAALHHRGIWVVWRCPKSRNVRGDPGGSANVKPLGVLGEHS